MSYLTPAQASAQFISLIVFAAAARWYAVPWLNARPLADALTALLWVHVFRYVALQVFSAQHDRFPISDHGALEIVIGDVAGAAMAFAAIALLRRGAAIAIALAWLLAAETAYDTVTNIHGGVGKHLMGAASGVTWMILVFFVPAVVVSCVLMVWQLYARRGESLGPQPQSVPQADIPPCAGPDFAPEPSWFETRSEMAPFATASLSLGLLGRTRFSP